MSTLTTNMQKKTHSALKSNILSSAIFLILIGLNITKLCNAENKVSSQLNKPFFVHPIKAINPHTAVYALSVGGFHIGHIQYQLNIKKNNIFEYLFNSNLRFFVLYDKRHVASEFTLNKDQLQITPIKFSQDRQGTGKDFKENIVFNRKTNKAQSQYNKKSIIIDTSTLTFDPLNAQLQMRLDLLSGKKIFNYPYISDNKADKIAFTPINQEVSNIKGIDFVTQKVEVTRKSKKRNTYIWFAKDIAFLPIKIEDSRKGKEAIIAELVFYQEGTGKNQITIGEKITIEDQEKKKKKKRHLRK